MKRPRQNEGKKSELISRLMKHISLSHNWYIRWRNKIDELEHLIDETTEEGTEERTKIELIQEKKLSSRKSKNLTVITFPCGHKVHRCCLEHPISRNQQDFGGRPITPSKPNLSQSEQTHEELKMFLSDSTSGRGTTH